MIFTSHALGFVCGVSVEGAAIEVVFPKDTAPRKFSNWVLLITTNSLAKSNSSSLVYNV
ncbi:hypothetical protein [Flavobacterium sp. LM5]|uniref:hypothetical protein n=1 Tax=Flavobacterium sp. LM5 TaxID=1938610 RepID=UPI0016703B94|nr:hypothetical protein [Flavobacterium sp. LM5]